MLKPLRGRNAPAHAERFRRHFQSRRGLAAFVFVQVDQANHALAPSSRRSRRRRCPRRIFPARRRASRIASSNSYGGSESWSVWSGRNSADGALVIDDAGIIPVPRVRVGIDPFRQPIDHRLRHVADHGQTAAHVAVKRAIADRDFAFVSGGEQERAELVRQRHQHDAAQSRLDIFLRGVFGRPAKTGLSCALTDSNAVWIGITSY